MKASKSSKYSSEHIKISNRNLSVELLRFLFALLVVMVHTHGLRPDDPNQYPFAGGYIAVEFFLILSGYFIVKSTSEVKAAPDQCGKISLQLTWKKFQSIFFYVFSSVILEYAVEAIARQESLHTIVKNYMYSVFEFLLFPMTGIYQTFFNLPLWYLSAFFLVLPFFQYLLLRFRDFATTVFLMIVPLVVYGHFCVTYGELDKWNIWYGFFYIGTLRVLAGLCVGGLLFFASSSLRKIQFTKISQVCVSIFQLGIIATVFIISYGKAHSRMDFILVSLLALLILFTLSDKGVFSHIVKGRFFALLGKLSVPLFTSHWAVRQLVPYLMPKATYAEMLPIYLMLSIALSLTLFALKAWIDKIQIGDRIKRCLIK